MLSNQIKLFKNRAFALFTLSCGLAMFGNGLTYIIMVWTLMRFSPSVTSTALLMTCFWLPNVLLGPFFGVIADRANRKKLLILVNGLRALCLFGFAFLAASALNALAVYLLALIIGTLLSIYIPLAMTFVRELVSKKDLLYSNATVDIAYEFGAVLGMGGAGVILATTSSVWCFIINGCCYLVAMVLVFGIAYRRERDEEDCRESLLQEFIQGGRYILAHPPILLIYMVQGLFFVCIMTAPVLLAPFATTVLHSNVSQFGWLESMLSVGIVIGGVVSPWLANRFLIQRVILFQIGLAIVAFYLFSHSEQIRSAEFFHFLIGFSFSAWALLTTLAQQLTALAYQGRVQSLFNSVSGVVIVLFYYILAHLKHAPIISLYWGEMILLIIAGLLMQYSVMLARRSTPH